MAVLWQYVLNWLKPEGRNGCLPTKGSIENEVHSLCEFIAMNVLDAMRRGRDAQGKPSPRGTTLSP